MTESQNSQIRKHLQSGRTINPMEALNLYGCFRLASRIKDLRYDGLEVHKEMVERKGKRFAEYSLEQHEDNEVVCECTFPLVREDMNVQYCGICENRFRDLSSPGERQSPQ